MRWWPWTRRGRDEDQASRAKPAKAATPAPTRLGSLRRTLVLWGGVGLALAAGLVFLFFFSAAFVVKDIAVEGAKGEVADSVVEAAMIPHGRPLARVSQANVRERVLADLRVADVTVRRHWPDAVTFEVTLREPALALQQGKEVWLSDAAGVVYGSATKAPKKVPLLQVTEAPDQLGEATVKGLVDLWATRPKNKALEGKLSTPVLAKNGTVTLQVDQLSIVWGPPVDAEKKWAVVTALVAQDAIDPTGAVPQTIDVSLPDQPVVTGLPPVPQTR